MAMIAGVASWLCTPHHLVLARGRTVRRVSVPGWMAAGAVLCVGGLLACGVAATGLMVTRDGLVSGAQTRQSAIRDQYEDRIAALRTQIQRIRSQQVVDQGSVTDRLEALLRRQATIEQRQSVVQALTARPGSAVPALPDEDPTPDQAPPVAAGDAPDVRQPVVIRGKQAVLVPGVPHLASLGPDMSSLDADKLVRNVDKLVRNVDKLAQILDSVATSLDGMEQQQLSQLAGIESRARHHTNQVRDVLADLGLDPDRLTMPRTAAEGGPLLPLARPGPDSDMFDQQVYRTQAAVLAGDRSDLLARAMPLRHPFAHAEITSGFGARLDPFLGTASIHPGIDFRQEEGSSVRVTAAGRITQAGWVGGYGNMVEVDHGNGLATRYGHLSAILVGVGDTVAQGEVVGRVGSTGRSTGPHLHYETRIAGEAVDPLRFMRAGDALAQRG